MNFTWWVNRKDADDNNVFAGGFLGLDNIGVFDRSQPLLRAGTPWSRRTALPGWRSTARPCSPSLWNWRASDPAYEDVASKFFEHFVAIADAMNTLGGHGLWDEADGFYYDQLHSDGRRFR